MPFAAMSTTSRDDLLARLSAPVAPALAETERRLESLIPADTGGLVAVIYRHMLTAGGKRLRPLLVLLSTLAAGGDPAEAVNVAIAVEVLHLSSLIHDDVIDEASERRGPALGPSAVGQPRLHPGGRLPGRRGLSAPRR